MTHEGKGRANCTDIGKSSSLLMMFYAFYVPGKRGCVAGLLSDVLGLFLCHVVLLEDPGQEQDETSSVPTLFRPAVGQTTTVSSIPDDRKKCAAEQVS
jgi:hypothetical protein